MISFNTVGQRGISRFVAGAAITLGLSSQVPSHQTINTTSVHIIPELSLSVPEAITKVSTLLLDLAVKLPVQNLRYMNVLLSDLSDKKIDKPEGIDAALYNELFSIKMQIIDLVYGIRKNPDLLDATPEQKKDLAVIRTATSVIDLVNHFKRSKAEIITITPTMGLTPYQISYDPQRSAIHFLTDLTSAKRLESKAASTAKAEAETADDSLSIKLFKSQYPGRKPIPGQRPFHFYVDAYNIDKTTPLPGLESLKADLQDLSYKYPGKVINDKRIWIGDYSFKATKSNSWELSPSGSDRYVDLEQHVEIFQLIKANESAYNEAASLLVSSHPDISADTFKIYLMLNTFAELFWAQNEDPWQDAGAASWYNLPQAGSFMRTYQDYLDKGFVLGVRLRFKENDGTLTDRIHPCPPKLWRMGSLMVPVEQQGLGPNAILIGHFLEMAEADQTLFNKYFPDTEISVENAVRIAMDMQLSIKAIAFSYDSIISKLKATLFSDPDIKLPDDVYPSIKDAKESRAYFLLSVARYWKAFPEFIHEKGQLFNFPYNHNSWNMEFLDNYLKIFAAILDVKDPLPNSETNYFPNNGGGVWDAFGDGNDPKIKEGWKVIVLPKQ